MQKLYVVTATYRQTRPVDNGGARQYGSTRTLVYGDRSVYLQGVGDICDLPILTMEQEFNREGCTWVDKKGVSYSLKEEWGYVNGEAKTKPGCTPGTRDEDNHDMSVQDFMDRVNAYINNRRVGILAVKRRSSRAGGAAAERSDPLPDELATLTRAEVISVRLYAPPRLDLHSL